MKPNSYYDERHQAVPESPERTLHRVSSSKAEQDLITMDDYIINRHLYVEMNEDEMAIALQSGKFLTSFDVAIDDNMKRASDAAHDRIKIERRHDIFNSSGIINSATASLIYKEANRRMLKLIMTPGHNHGITLDNQSQVIIDTMLDIVNEQGGIDYINNPPDIDSLILQLEIMTKLVDDRPTTFKRYNYDCVIEYNS